MVYRLVIIVETWEDVETIIPVKMKAIGVGKWLYFQHSSFPQRSSHALNNRNINLLESSSFPHYDMIDTRETGTGQVVSGILGRWVVGSPGDPR